MTHPAGVSNPQATVIAAANPDGAAPIAFAVDSFASNFGYRPAVVGFAPGRVNLIGEHTDYNGGLCLPCAINLHTAVALGIRPSTQQNQSTETQGRVRLRSTWSADEMHFPISPHQHGIQVGWSRYLAGVLHELQRLGAAALELDVQIHSDVPVGSGLSSSAALEVAFAKACCLLHGLTIDNRELARLCQRAEHQFAGVPCGLMDQMAAIFGESESLLALDFSDDSWTPIAFAENTALVVVHSGVSHRLAGSEYAARRDDCKEAALLLGITSLSSIKDLPPAWEQLLGPRLFRRVRHVVTENERVKRFCAAMIAGEVDQAGGIMYESHHSLRLDYEVSCGELDALVDVAALIGAAGGVWGARMTGGGFGGCIVVLTTRSAAESVAENFRKHLIRTGNRPPGVWVLRPVTGAGAKRTG